MISTHAAQFRASRKMKNNEKTQFFGWILFCERNFYDVADFQMDINFKVMRIRTRPVFDIILKIWFPCAIWNIQNSCRNFCPVAEIHIRMIFHLMRISFWIRDFFACFQSFHGYVWKILLIFEIPEIFTNPFGTITFLWKISDL